MSDRSLEEMQPFHELFERSKDDHASKMIVGSEVREVIMHLRNCLKSKNPEQGEELPPWDGVCTDAEKKEASEWLCGASILDIQNLYLELLCREKQLRMGRVPTNHHSEFVLPERPKAKSLTSRHAYFGDEAEAYFDALEAEIGRLKGEVKDYEECYIGSKRLVRELDIAMHGDENAAPQASLCDLIGPAEDLRRRAEAAELALSASRADALKEALEAVQGERLEQHDALLNMDEVGSASDAAYSNAIHDAETAILARMEKAS